MALVAGIVGLYAQLSAMNTTMILRDNSYQQQLNELKKVTDVQGEYVRDLRERIIRQEAGKKKG
jgi:phosphoglycerate-specific signal transduction histidine kinase